MFLYDRIANKNDISMYIIVYYKSEDDRYRRN